MKISLIAVGRIRRGPERDLVDDYLKRARRLSGPLGIREVTETEVEAGGLQTAEADVLTSKIPSGAQVILFDETGQDLTSLRFSAEIEKLKDQGCPHLAFLIGGADGFTDELKARHTVRVRLGALTWPHKLVRVLAAEQIYRALSLMAGTPYHRE